MSDIYLDHAAATPLDQKVLKVMQPFLDKTYGNPSSIHSMGKKAKQALEKARADVAKILHAQSKEITFTCGGTESINLAIKGVAFQKGSGHIITSAVEHPAVLETCKFLQTKGFRVTYLDVDRFGLISTNKLEKAIKRDTILISVMYANNEVGTIQPIREIGQIAQRHNVPFHTDACQAGLLDLNVDKLNVDLLTLNGSKIYGPQCGILYKHNGLKLQPLLHGGNQESGLRSGTENVPNIVGFAKALQVVQKNKEKENKRLTELRNYFVTEVLQKIHNTELNGHPKKRMPGNVNISFGVDAEMLLNHLDQKGIYVSTGSACKSGEIDVSPVLKALGREDGIRFSFGRSTRKEDLRVLIRELKVIVGSLRKVLIV
jgi:cysteine desulfurase